MSKGNGQAAATGSPRAARVPPRPGKQPTKTDPAPAAAPAAAQPAIPVASTGEPDLPPVPGVMETLGAMMQLAATGKLRELYAVGLLQNGGLHLGFGYTHGNTDLVRASGAIGLLLETHKRAAMQALMPKNVPIEGAPAIEPATKH